MTYQTVTIDKRVISPDHPPYVVAEMSANHNGKLENALKIIEMAKRAGADALKIQTYTQDTITINSHQDDFKIQSGLWKGRTLYELYQQAHLPWEWHKPLFDKARELGITMFSSPFDFTAVDFLEDLNVPAYKIASFEAIDIPLIRYTASTGKPLIISTGMANEQEIQEAVEAAKEGGCKELIVLHCVSGYPSPPSDYNLATLPHMASQFGVLAGLSDHTIDNTTAIASVALGACLIEKHVTLSRDGGGPDDSFSLEEQDLTALCQDSKTAWQALGKVDYERKSSERENMVFRRSLYAVKDIAKGEVLTKDNVRSIRPGYGLKPKYYSEVLGQRATENLTKGTALTKEMVGL